MSNPRLIVFLLDISIEHLLPEFSTQKIGQKALQNKNKNQRQSKIPLMTVKRRAAPKHLPAT